MSESSRRSMRRPRRRARVGRLIVAGVAALVLLVLGAGGVYLWSLAKTLDSDTEKLTDVFPAEESRPPVATPAPGDADAPLAQNLLLLGSDTRGDVGGSLEEAGGRSDAILVVHIPADRENIQVMSIMRDSWVEIPGHGFAKVNAALAYGGVPLTVQTVEFLIGARIDHVAIVDFEGFRGITDALNGVEIDNPVAFQSTHLQGHRFAAGPQTMDGEEALAFVRERYAFRDGDYQRVRNQQLFLKAVIGETLSGETLSNPFRISSLVNALAPYLTVDEGLDSGYVAGLALELRGVRADDIMLFTMPTSGIGTEDGQSVVNVDWTELELVRAGFAKDSLDEYEPEIQTIG